MNADGSSPINLTYNPADDNHPTWSADEQKIAFQSDRDGNNEVYVLNTDDRSLMNLTNNPADDQRPAWSSDEKKIAFQSDRDGNNEIYVMNADGSNPIKLTNNPADDQSPAWSADGQKIAFQSDRDGNNEIYVMNADGSQPIKLTNNPNNDNQPTWSSDGKKIAFQSDRDGNNEIYLMNADGSNPINLTNNLAADKSPAWSFNGNKIAFASDRDGNYEIYVMSADGSRPIQSTEIPIQPTTIKAEYQTQDLGNPDYQTSFARSAFDSQEWPTRDSKGAKLFWGEDNTYIFDIQPPSVSITALYLDGKKKFINSIVEVDVKFSDKEGEVGIVCRGYKAIFNSNGRTTISLINNPYNYTYLFSNDSEIIKEIGKYYRLRFDCIGQLLTVYENGVKIGEVQDNKFIAGSVGLIVRPNNSFHVAFDNFKLWLP
jgi:dipeptidyl aminopeptidase/acylaminoacyl peptidase